MMKVIGTAIVAVILTSAFWLFYHGISGELTPGDGEVRATDEKVVDRGAKPSVTLAKGIVVGPAGLAIPVQGVKPGDLVDTFTQARAGGGRSHDAIDIMAANGTPVLATADGVVEKLFFSGGGGGISVYVRSPDRRWTYYYAHLAGYTPGLAEGQRVKRGQLIGSVGSTGNANPAGPHLHFAINRMQPGEKWYHGTPVNPYPLLAGRGASG